MCNSSGRKLNILRCNVKYSYTYQQLLNWSWYQSGLPSDHWVGLLQSAKLPYQLPMIPMMMMMSEIEIASKLIHP